MPRILIVDDEVSAREILAEILSPIAGTILTATGREEAQAVISSTPLDLVITDQMLGDGEGIEIIVSCRDTDRSLPVILITAHATMDLAITALREGAFDFITKPFLRDTVTASVTRAVKHGKLVRENRRLKREISRLAVTNDIIGESSAIQEIKNAIHKVARAQSAVFITGETGTGKELVARAIHKASDRRAEPFIAVNCASFPESLLEAQLFGHERGAFTGADESRPGLFEAAHGGTLFLDEAAEMSIPLQAKLLRVLADGMVMRVGSVKPRKVDVRIIAATNRNIEEEVSAERFREDLYYRLAVLPIHIPPLRERKEDIPILLQHMLRAVSGQLGLRTRDLSESARMALEAYPFPGNIRELENIIERAYILGEGPVILVEDLPLNRAPVARNGHDGTVQIDKLFEAWSNALPETQGLRETLEQIERKMIVDALETAQGVQAEAGRILGISRSDLGYKLKKYQIEVQ